MAGGEVFDTAKGGIIDPAAVEDPSRFIWLMFAARLAGAVWLDIATSLGGPVSTTQSMIGAKMEAAGRAAHAGRDRDEVEAYLRKFETVSVKEKQRMSAEMKMRAAEVERAELSRM